MAITDKQCEQLFYRALDEEVGIAVQIAPEDMHRTKTQLYAVKKAIADPRLDIIVIFDPEPIDAVTELWLVKKTVELPNV